MPTRSDIASSMKLFLDGPLPPDPVFTPGIRRAPDRGFRLSRSQTAVALKNALRYLPEAHHSDLIPEFLEELETRGRIYGYRFGPEGDIRALPIDRYTGNCLAGKACQLMMGNNLDVDVALYGDQITLPFLADDDAVQAAVDVLVAQMKGTPTG